MFPVSLQTPVSVWLTHTRPQPAIPHLNSTYHQCLYQAETQPKNDVGKENSAIGVNYPGRKSTPRWLVTRGEVIKTKGMEGNADQRGAHGAVRILPASFPNFPPPMGKLRVSLTAPRDTSGVCYSSCILPRSLSLVCRAKHLPLRANNSDAEEREKKENHCGCFVSSSGFKNGVNGSEDTWVWSMESGSTITLELKQHSQHMPGWRGADRAQGKKLQKYLQNWRWQREAWPSGTVTANNRWHRWGWSIEHILQRSE